ncbi:MerR family transcriptional regulator [Amycolatopsis sp. FU40]|uniref:helix-turn-helix domain-containing protein n=1 Tax=Amycolatopsis sp. FU40 TaxID=2914159 RepID=UPI001F416832|nr:MerR family transcriptional regulator [Amycolatopsis sp. FU40]UKD57642.1 MerR family transcriptional regulator [Amycolatopsis sp. FU40]
MDETTDRYPIGELARRTGLSARTIRYWSDSGVLPPAERSAGGYRLYRADAVGRLHLIKTLRELGLGLDSVREVLERHTTLAQAAASHVEALEAQIQILRLNRAVPRNALSRDTETEGLALTHELARLPARERQQFIDGFVGNAFAGVDDPDALVIAEFMREVPPQLPADPTSAQADAWIELAELVSDDDFQHTLREMGSAEKPTTASSSASPSGRWFSSTLARRSRRESRRSQRPDGRSSTASCPPISATTSRGRCSNGSTWSPNRASNAIGSW